MDGNQPRNNADFNNMNHDSDISQVQAASDQHSNVELVENNVDMANDDVLSVNEIWALENGEGRQITKMKNNEVLASETHIAKNITVTNIEDTFQGHPALQYQLAGRNDLEIENIANEDQIPPD